MQNNKEHNEFLQGSETISDNLLLGATPREENQLIKNHKYKNIDLNKTRLPLEICRNFVVLLFTNLILIETLNHLNSLQWPASACILPTQGL